MTVAPDKLAEIQSRPLDRGSHTQPADGWCVMEAVAYVAREPFSDHPACVSPVIGAFLRSWNDALPDDDRQMLKPLIPAVIGTATGNAADDDTRAWLATDWLVRECAPGFLRLAGLTDQAALLENLAALTGREDEVNAQPTIALVRKDAAAARAAAWDAAWAAAWDAARAAAEKGGNYDDQYAAAFKVAKPLIEAKFDPVTKGLQQSALKLVERMANVGRDRVAA